MSAAGDFIAACRRRGLEIRIVGDEVSLRGCQRDVDEMIGHLMPVVNEVHGLMSDFYARIPPRRGAEKH